MASASTRACRLLNLTKSGLSGRNLEHASLFFCIHPPPVYLPPTFNRILSYTHHFTNMLTLTSTTLSVFWTNHPSLKMALNIWTAQQKCSKSSGELMFHSNRRRLMCHNCSDLEILKRLLKLDLPFFSRSFFLSSLDLLSCRFLCFSTF